MGTIIGFDPGPEGFAAVMLKGRVFFELSRSLRAAVNHIVFEGEPVLVAIETPQNYGMTMGRSMVQTCITVGRILREIESRPIENLEVRQYGRPTIKGALGAKTDADVRASLRLRFCTCGSKGACKKGCKLHGLDNDARAALAVAVAVQENPGLKEW